MINGSFIIIIYLHSGCMCNIVCVDLMLHEYYNTDCFQVVTCFAKRSELQIRLRDQHMTREDEKPLRGCSFIVALTFFVLVALTFVHNTRGVVQARSPALLSLREPTVRGGRSYAAHVTTASRMAHHRAHSPCHKYTTLIVTSNFITIFLVLLSH